MAVLTNGKMQTLPKFAYSFLCEKVHFGLIHSTNINIHSFSRTLLSSWVLPVTSKGHIKTNSKKE